MLATEHVSQHPAFCPEDNTCRMQRGLAAADPFAEDYMLSHVSGSTTLHKAHAGLCFAGRGHRQSVAWSECSTERSQSLTSDLFSGHEDAFDDFATLFPNTQTRHQKHNVDQVTTPLIPPPLSSVGVWGAAACEGTAPSVLSWKTTPAVLFNAEHDLAAYMHPYMTNMPTCESNPAANGSMSRKRSAWAPTGSVDSPDTCHQHYPRSTKKPRDGRLDHAQQDHTSFDSTCGIWNYSRSETNAEVARRACAMLIKLVQEHAKTVPTEHSPPLPPDTKPSVPFPQESLAHQQHADEQGIDERPIKPESLNPDFYPASNRNCYRICLNKALIAKNEKICIKMRCACCAK